MDPTLDRTRSATVSVSSDTSPQLNMALLDALTDSTPDWIPFERLAEITGSEAGPLRDDLDLLETFGFSIERHPLYGIRYAGPAWRLCPDQIEWKLNTHLIGRRIAVWNRVTSTNDVAMRAAASRANDGLVVLAEWQTQGRGRRGRRWEASPGSGLLMSALLFPPADLRDSLLLTCLAGVAVCETLETAFHLRPRLKWPNDVLIDGKKVCGILVESAEGVVVGVGLNCNGRAEAFSPELRETTSTLAEQIGQRIDRSLIARLLIQTLDSLYHALRHQGRESLWRRWRDRAGLLGATVEIELARERIRGVVTQLDADGTLHLERHCGGPQAVRLQHVLTLTIHEVPRTSLARSASKGSRIS